MIKKLFSKKSIFIIAIILIISMIGVIVYGSSIPKSNMNVDKKELNLGHGESDAVTYTVAPQNLDKFDVNQNLQKDIVLVLDTSLTMKKAMPEVVKIAKKFVNNFYYSRYVRVGLVEYNGEATVLTRNGYYEPALVSPRYDWEELNYAIDSLDTGWNGKDETGGNKHWGTNTGEGIRTAMGLLNQDKNVPSSSKYIIFMSDGTPQVYTGTYPNYYMQTYNEINLNTFDFGWNYKHQNFNLGYKVNGYYTNPKIGTEYAYHMASEIANQGIKNYDIYFRSTNKNPNKLQQQRSVMQNIANKASGEFLEAKDSDKLEDIFQELASSIDSEYTLGNVKLNLNIPEGVKVKKITYIQNGQEKSIDLNSMTLPNILYNYDYEDGEYKTAPFQIKVEYEGENTTEENIKSYSISGDITTNDASIGELPDINVNVKKSIRVKISVTDSRGNVGTPYDTINGKASNLEYDELSQNNTLIGQGLANVDVSGVTQNSDSDYYLNYRFIKKDESTNVDWQTVPLDSEEINADIDYDKPNNLTFRSYDVNHLPTTSGGDRWSNPSLVFKNPSSNIKYLPTTIASTKSQYGYLTTYIDSDGRVKYKWVPKMAFYDNMIIGGDYKEASKYWGYIQPKKTGWYKLGLYCDDGAKGMITVNGKSQYFSKDGFYPHGAEDFPKGGSEPIKLEAGKFYPVSLEYFNWGGGGAFKMFYYYSDYKNWGYSWQKYIGEDDSFTFYPSKSKEPGESADSSFSGGKSGLQFPTEEGSYYIEYNIVAKNKNNPLNQKTLKEGKYGYFNVENRFITNISIANNEELYQGKSYDLNYTLTPKPIATKDITNTSGAKLPSQIVLTDLNINGLLPPGIKFVTKGNSSLNQNSNSNYVIEKSGAETPKGSNFTIEFKNNLVYTLDRKDMLYKASQIQIPVRIQIGKIGEFVFDGSDNRINYKYSGDNMATITQYFPTININAMSSSKIIEMGILDSSSQPSNITNANDISNIVNGIPSKVAFSVRVNSPSTAIDIYLNQAYLKSGTRSISVKKYKIINGKADFSTSEVADFNISNNKIEIKEGNNFTLNSGETYLLVLNITPNISSGNQLKVEAIIEGATDSDKHYSILEPTDMPDVF